MATEIHETAVIDPGAEIGENVQIGPHCVIFAGVRIGDDCWLQNHVTVAGNTEIGKGNQFYAFGSIGQKTQDLKYEKEPTYLKIGDGNTFREFCTLNRATLPGDSTVIGNDGCFLAYTHIGHDCVVGDHVIFSNNSTLGGHVMVGDYAILSGLTGIHQFCRIGAHSFIGGCAKIVQDVPPFMMVDGNPARARSHNAVGLQRRNFSADSVKAIKDAYKILYRQNLKTSDAADKIESMKNGTEETRQIAEFVRCSERGITEGFKK